MIRGLLSSLLVLCATLGAAPVMAADSFTLVNGTDRAMADVSIRRFGGGEWDGLGLTLGPGSKAPVSFAHPDCAFDIRASLGGGLTAIWSGVNLCEVNIVTVKRELTGELWVEYD